MYELHVIIFVLYFIENFWISIVKSQIYNSLKEKNIHILLLK